MNEKRRHIFLLFSPSISLSLSTFVGGCLSGNRNISLAYLSVKYYYATSHPRCLVPLSLLNAFEIATLAGFLLNHSEKTAFRPKKTCIIFHFAKAVFTWCYTVRSDLLGQYIIGILIYELFYIIELLRKYIFIY